MTWFIEMLGLLQSYPSWVATTVRISTVAVGLIVVANLALLVLTPRIDPAAVTAKVAQTVTTARVHIAPKHLDNVISRAELHRHARRRIRFQGLVWDTSDIGYPNLRFLLGDDYQLNCAFGEDWSKRVSNRLVGRQVIVTGVLKEMSEMQTVATLEHCEMEEPPIAVDRPLAAGPDDALWLEPVTVARREEAARAWMRKDRGVEPLIGADANLQLERMPRGRYGFTYYGAVGRKYATADVSMIASTGVELHKTSDGVIFLVGFIGEETALELGRDAQRQREITVYSLLWDTAPRIVAIPVFDQMIQDARHVTVGRPLSQPSALTLRWPPTS